MFASQVKVFDPALPHNVLTMSEVTLDTFFEDILMASQIADELDLPSTNFASLRISSGAKVSVPKVKIGITIGNIRIDSIDALLVENGDWDIVIGRSCLEKLMQLAEATAQGVRITSELKDDPLSLAIELYAVAPPVDLVNFERFLSSLRRLYNIALLPSSNLILDREDDLADLIWHDVGIPDEIRLMLTWVDSGSIWLTLKSGCTAALEFTTKLFHMGATAKVGKLAAEARASQNQAAIDEQTRDAIASRIIDEQRALSAEQLARTYETWRKEVLANVKVNEELIATIKNPVLARKARKELDEAIAELIEQKFLPVVRNIPHVGEVAIMAKRAGDDIQALPPPKRGGPEG